MEGILVRTIVGYSVDKSRGYSLFGVHAKGDTPFQHAVEESMRSFKVNVN